MNWTKPFEFSLHLMGMGNVLRQVTIGRIMSKTCQGKIDWEPGKRMGYVGTVPGAGLQFELEYHSDQRDGDWYTLTAKLGRRTIDIEADSDKLKELYDYIHDQPDLETVQKVNEILKSL